MARPREFDVDQALDAALDVFWSHGFAATSVADLVAATGLPKGSIYKAWSDKRDLFLHALRRYEERSLADLERKLTRGASPRAAIESWLKSVGDACCGGEADRGCFAINSIVELAPHDDEVAALATGQLQREEQLLARTIQAAQQRGEVGADVEPRDAAAFLVALVCGLNVRGREPMGRAQVRRVLQLAIATLD